MAQPDWGGKDLLVYDPDWTLEELLEDLVAKGLCGVDIEAANPTTAVPFATGAPLGSALSPSSADTLGRVSLRPPSPSDSDQSTASGSVLYEGDNATHVVNVSPEGSRMSQGAATIAATSPQLDGRSPASAPHDDTDSAPHELLLSSLSINHVREMDKKMQLRVLSFLHEDFNTLPDAMGLGGGGREEGVPPPQQPHSLGVDEMLELARENESRARAINDALGQIAQQFAGEASAAAVVCSAEKERAEQAHQQAERAWAEKEAAEVRAKLEAERRRVEEIARRQAALEAQKNAERKKLEMQAAQAAKARQKPTSSVPVPAAPVADAGPSGRSVAPQQQPSSRDESIPVNTDYISDGAQTYLSRIMGTWMKVKAQADRVLREKDSNPQVKSMWRQIRKTVNTTIAQISASRRQIVAKVTALSDLLDHARSSGDHWYSFCLDCVAAKLVIQGQVQCARHQESAFPIAEVSVYVCIGHPMLTNVLMAHFARACPYTVPHYVPRNKDEAVADYRARIGYKQLQNGELESDNDYEERMAGITAIHAAIMQTPVPGAVSHPFGIHQCWAWLARMLNMTPRRATASVMITFLNIASYELHRAYGSQFRKAMAFLAKDFVNRIPDTSKGPRARLRQFLAEYSQRGVIEMPKGRQYGE